MELPIIIYFSVKIYSSKIPKNGMVWELLLVIKQKYHNGKNEIIILKKFDQADLKIAIY